MFSQAVQAVATMAQIPVTFDMVPVLTYVQSLHTTGISLHLLSSIALFLTVHSSISRVSCVACLGLPLLEQRVSVDLIRNCVLFVHYLLILPRWGKSANYEIFILHTHFLADSGFF